MEHPIDFVIPWVDGGDPQWQELRNGYITDKTKIREAQYRDWGLLKYWFRAVEVYAPWVNKIHFVTCGQIPAWLNTEHPKLHCVDHREYIPEEYLPTFSSHVIELNFHRIPGLAEHFVYFNDDIYLNAQVKPEDFFMNGLPRESAVLQIMTPAAIEDPFGHVLWNDMALLNRHFAKKEVLKKFWYKWYHPSYGKQLLRNIYATPGKSFSLFYNFHVASSMRKSTFEEVWQKEREILHTTCCNKFRTDRDVNQYLMGWYNLCKGEFVPRQADFGKYYTIGQHTDAVCEDIHAHKHCLICVNDNPADIDVEKEREHLVRMFEEMFPRESSFERKLVKT